MKKRILLALKWFLIALPVIWGAVALWLWHKLAGCSSPLSSYCVEVYKDGFLRFFSMSWVWEYQTLVAGVFAFAAGAFAYYSAVTKIRHQEATERAVKRIQLRTACLVLVDAFRETQEILDELRRIKHTNNQADQNNDIIGSSGESLTLIYEISPILGWVTARNARYLRSTVGKLNKQTASIDLFWEIDGMILLCSSATILLAGIADNVPERGEYDFQMPGNKVRAGHLIGIVEKTQKIPELFNAYRNLFDWS